MKAHQTQIFDLHCDTISECYHQKKSLLHNDLQLDLERGNRFSAWFQTFAFWMPDTLTGAEAWQLFHAMYQYFWQQYRDHPDAVTFCDDTKQPVAGKCNALLAIEGSSLIEQDIERIHILKGMGISMMTLTWNGDNQIGGGVRGTGIGLTHFGREAVRAMQDQNILIDVSHLSDAGFYDIAELSEVPFLATHSNARAVHGNKRNLTDDQIRVLVQRRGLVGVNFYPEFVNGENDYGYPQLFAHIDHILGLGGEDILALGSDFDGADMPHIIPGIKGLENLSLNMIEYFGEEITQKVLFNNAKCFFDKNKKE